jgi:putative methanogenesis marker protein 8
MTFSIEDIVERCNRRFVHIGGDFVLVEDSRITCPFLRVKTWQEAWMALYLRKLKFGQFTDHRQIKDCKKYVPFGATEIIMEALTGNILDAAVIACDGAGTVITDRPDIVQGIGGRMSGLVYTMPRTSVIERLQKEKAIVLDPETACINAVRGAKKALEHYKKIAVTVTASKDIERLQRMPGVSIFVVHTTGVSAQNAEYTINADIVWACASKYVRDIAGPHALVQLGVGIPVFVMTERGLNLIIPRITELSPKTGKKLKENIKSIQTGATYVIHHKKDKTGIDLVMNPCELPVLRPTGPHPLI